MPKLSSASTGIWVTNGREKNEKRVMVMRQRRTTRSRRAIPKPLTSRRQPFGPEEGTTGGITVTSTATMTATKVTALTANTHETPTPA